MRLYGYKIVQTLIVDVEPDAKVKAAMNEINAGKPEEGRRDRGSGEGEKGGPGRGRKGSRVEGREGGRDTGREGGRDGGWKGGRQALRRDGCL